MTRATDEELMARFQCGLDDEPMEELLRRHLGSALAVASRILSDPVAAEDAVQETFLRVVRSRQRYSPDRPFGTWFYTILRNTCRDMLRARARRARLAEGAAEARTDRDTVPGPGPEGLVEMLASLSAPLRAALELRIVEGLSFQEVAAALGITEEAAKKRAQRGLRRLRDWAETRRRAQSSAPGLADVPRGEQGTYTVGKDPGSGGPL